MKRTLMVIVALLFAVPVVAGEMTEKEKKQWENYNRVLRWTKYDDLVSKKLSFEATDAWNMKTHYITKQWKPFGSCDKLVPAVGNKAMAAFVKAGLLKPAAAKNKQKYAAVVVDWLRYWKNHANNNQIDVNNAALLYFGLHDLLVDPLPQPKAKKEKSR